MISFNTDFIRGVTTRLNALGGRGDRVWASCSSSGKLLWESGVGAPVTHPLLMEVSTILPFLVICHLLIEKKHLSGYTQNEKGACVKVLLRSGIFLTCASHWKTQVSLLFKEQNIFSLPLKTIHRGCLNNRMSLKGTEENYVNKKIRRKKKLATKSSFVLAYG